MAITAALLQLTTAASSSPSVPTTSSYTDLLNQLPDVSDTQMEESMNFAEQTGRNNQMRFQEASTTEEPAEEEASPQAPMDADEMNRLRAAGASDTEVAIEQTKQKMVQDKMETASKNMEQEEKEDQEKATLEQNQNEANEANAKDESAASMDQALERAAADESQKQEMEKEKDEAKKKVLEKIKEEAETEAEVESVKMADMSPEEILNLDKSERQSQYLSSLSPGAIAAAELELSSVFSSVIGSLLTNMLTKEPELIRSHMGVPLSAK